MIRRRKGFTLVELLVVVAIIGLLASIVLVNLNTARNRAKNAAIKTTLAELRIAAEWEYDSSDGSYGAICDSTNDLSVSGNFGRIKASLEKNMTAGSQKVCRDHDVNDDGVTDSCPDAASNNKRWCVRVTNMPAGGNWCTDYTGYSGSAANCDAINCTCQ